jgi:integrase/recombinase XerD
VGALVRLLDLLREQGITPRCATEAVPTRRETLLDMYRREERGLAQESVRNMLLFVDRFLAEKYPRDHFDFASLKANDITTFVRKQATKRSSAQAKNLVTALRSFPIPTASRRDPYGSCRLCPSRPGLFILHSPEISASRRH